MADIDSLQIKISADANKASNAIDKLAKSLESFQKSVTWDTGKLYSIGTGIKNIADAATGFKGAKSKELTSLSTALQNFNKVDTVYLRGVGSAISELSKGMSGVQNIDVSGVVNVASAVAKLGGKNATAGAKNLVTLKDDLSQFVRGMNNVGSITFDATNLSNLITSINKLGYGTVTAATKNLFILSAQMQNFVREMNKIGSFNFDMTNLSTMVTAIGKLGSVASGRAVSNIPQLADNLNYMFTVLSKAPAVNSNIIQMTNALANLARTGSSTGTASRSLANSLNMFNKSSKTAKASSFSLASAIGKVYATYWALFRVVGKVKDAIDLSSDLTETENVVRQTFGNYEGIIQDFVKTSISQYGMSELTAKQVASRFQAMGTAVGYTQKEMSGMSLELTKLTGDLASFYNEEQGDVAKRLQSIFTGETEPMRRYGIDLTNATLKEYAMSKGLNSNISSMTQAEKVMLRYQYVMERTSNAHGDFARTADTWANQVRQLKQQFEAWSVVVGGALINAFKPFVKTLNDVMQKVITFTTTVTNALGSIFGWKYEVSAGGVADDWSDSMSNFSNAEGDAADNAKKLKNNLLGIDELNVISKDDTSGSGTGSGGAGTAGATTGELVQVDTIFKDYESNIKDLYTLGRTISDTLSSAMDSINWDFIYEKARGFGTGLADFLNGLFTPDLFENIGITLAGVINTGIEFAFNFVKTFDWSNFGKSIANGVMGFFANIKWEELGETIVRAITGVIDLIFSFIINVNWFELVGYVLEMIISGILTLGEWLGEKWSDFIYWWDTSIGKWWDNNVSVWFTAERWQELGEHMKEALIEKWNDFKEWWKDTGIPSWWDNHVAPWFTKEKWIGLANNIKLGISEKWNSFTTWWKNTGFYNWWKTVSSYFTKTKWTWSGIKDGLSKAWNNAIDAIKSIWNKFANWLNEKLTFSWESVEIMGKEIISPGSITLGQLPTFETGGYVPNSYSMFVAGENGVPEMLGTVGGQTAVAGGVEITGIRDAINATAEAQMRMMQEEINLLKQLLAKETSVNIGDRDIARAALRGQKSMGLQIIT